MLPFMLLLVFLALTTFFYVQRARVEPLWKSWGDAFSDNNVMVAGEHFADKGIISLKGLATDLPLIKGPYTGWPPFADIANGLLRKIGLTSLFQFRCVALVAYVLFGLYLYALCRLMFGSRWAALAAVVLASMTPYIYVYSDSIHKHMYMEFFRAALLFHFVKYMRSAKPVHLVMGMMFAFANAYTSWEHTPFMLMLFVLYPVLFRSELHPRVTWLKTGLFGAAVALALCLFFVQVAWALGGVRAAYVNFRERAEVRTMDVVKGDYFKGYASGSFLKDVTPAKYLTTNVNRFTSTFMVRRPIFTACIILFVSMTLFLRRRFKPFLLLLMFLPISLFWLIVLIQHTVIHPFTINHLGTWFTLLIAFSFAYVIGTAKGAISGVSAAFKSKGNRIFAAGEAFSDGLSGWRGLGFSAVQLLGAAALVAVLWTPAQTIVKGYVTYYRTYSREMVYRLEAKRLSDLGVENVAYRLGSVSVTGTGTGTPAALIDNSYLAAKRSAPASFWGPPTTENSASGINVTLESTCELREIDIYLVADKPLPSTAPTRMDIQLKDVNSDIWLSVASVLATKPPEQQKISSGIVRFRYEIQPRVTRQARLVLSGQSSGDGAPLAVCELELWGRLAANTLNENILPNGDFRRAKGQKPEDWGYFSYTPAQNQARLVADATASGGRCFLIHNTAFNDSYLKQVVKLAPGAVYELSGRVKTEGVAGQKWSGATLDIEGDVGHKYLTERFIKGTRDWQLARVQVTTPPLIKPDTRLVLECRLGTYGDGAVGKAWFDNIQLKRIK